ncbi:MAG TPA: hypothetical protein VF041_22435 [Gemmatimonadaceae bacterium]
MPISLHDFERGAVPDAHFHHREHVRVAYELIARDPFDVALARFMDGIRRIAAASGNAAKVHVTITVAFLAVIAERQAREPAATWDQFVARNPDLFDKGFLRRWYTAGELDSDLARKTFLLPRPRESRRAPDEELR